MSQKLINHSPDLGRLQDEGYDIEIRSNHLLVKHVPYVSAKREVLLGWLVSPLNLTADVTTTPTDHTIMFVGEYPHHADGTAIEAIRNSSEKRILDDGLVVDHVFSGKNTTGPDANYYDKVVRYVAIITGEAMRVDPSATAQVNQFIEAAENDDSPFAYLDTASSNDGVLAVSRKLALGAVAIIGLGGTGSYVLDLIAKTPIKTIHLFDGDRFLQHNAFRSPGAASCDELRAVPLKVEYFADRYAAMHRGIVPHPYYLDRQNVDELRGVGFAFLCMDRGVAKRDIVTRLCEWKTPFIEIGMDIMLTDNALGGMLRVTTITSEQQSTMPHITYTDANANDDYSRPIQISDMNALNAAMAVIKWKKLCGFYRDLGHEGNSLYTIDCNMLINNEKS